MPKITFLGAGSTVFAKNLFGDIISRPELAGSTLCLQDIDAERLRFTKRLFDRILEGVDASPVIETTTDRREALDGADYVVIMFQIGGYKPATVVDFEIPKKYGLRQTIADTLGIGGIMRALRTIPVLLDTCREMEAFCPDALMLNYANPMAMNCWAISAASPVKMVGLCHSVQGTAAQLAEDIGVPIEEISYLSAGINHMAFYLRFERKHPDGSVEDLYPRIRAVIEEGRVPAWNRVRYEALKHLGYFVTESSEHFSEYVPWYIKRDRPDLIESFNIPLDEYITRCEVQNNAWQLVTQEMENPGSITPELIREIIPPTNSPIDLAAYAERSLKELYSVTPSSEYAATIMASIETGAPAVIYGNVPNRGLIDNLPPDCIVEVPCLVDGNGIQPTRVGSLPPQLAALIQTNINVQALTVEAALTKKREHIYHAAMLDPHTAAELDLNQIHNLVDKLLAAHSHWLPDYH